MKPWRIVATAGLTGLLALTISYATCERSKCTAKKIDQETQITTCQGSVTIYGHNGVEEKHIEKRTEGKPVLCQEVLLGYPTKDLVLILNDFHCNKETEDAYFCNEITYDKDGFAHPAKGKGYAYVARFEMSTSQSQELDFLIPEVRTQLID